MEQLPAILAAIVTSIGTIGAAYIGLRRANRLGKLGLGPVQDQINESREQLAKIWEAKFDVLSTDFAACKTKLQDTITENATLRRDQDRLQFRFDSLYDWARGKGWGGPD